MPQLGPGSRCLVQQLSVDEIPPVSAPGTGDCSLPFTISMKPREALFTEMSPPPLLHSFIHGGARLPGFPATSANRYRKPRFSTGARKNPLPLVKPDEASVNPRKKGGSRGGFGACPSGYLGAASAMLPGALPRRPSPSSDERPRRFLPTPGPLGPLPWSS